MKRILTVLFATGLSVLAASPSHSTTRRVPSVFSTIQAALSASISGDTVQVAPGTYAGEANKELDFFGFDICLVSESGPEVTILDAGGVGRLVHLFSGETSAACIEGFTLTHGNANTPGGGIALDGAAATVRNCIITDNLAPDGGGVSVANKPGSDTPVFENCVITNNFAGTSGGGILIAGTPEFLNCTIRGNATNGSGGGVAVVAGGSSTLTGCLITGNKAAAGGGVRASGGVNLFLIACTIAGNLGGSEGGGVSVVGQTASITSTIIWGNCASIGAGLHAGTGSTVFRSCTDIDGTDGPGTLPISASNRTEDPLFCDPLSCSLAPTTGGDYGLQASSPMVEDFECGTLGGIGSTCDDVPVEATTWGRIKAFRR